MLRSALILAYGPSRKEYPRILASNEVAYVLTLNNEEMSIKESTHHFDIHTPRHHEMLNLPKSIKRVISHVEPATSPLEQPFPIDLVKQALAPSDRLMLHSTMAYMMAYCLVQLPVKRVFLAGVDFQPSYAKPLEKDSVTFWCGVLAANHIEVIPTTKSTLIPPGIYT